MADKLHLGDNIVLSGFALIEKPKLSVIRKLVGEFVKEASAHREDFQHLEILLDPGHEESFSLHGTLGCTNGVYTADFVESNLFIGIGKLLEELKKKCG